MASKATQYTQRLSHISTEVEIVRRKRREEASKAISAIRRITKEDIELLSPIVPNIRHIVSFSEQDILENAHGERDMIRSVMAQLRDHTEERLQYYESQL